MQVLQKASMGGDILRGYTVISRELSKEQVAAAGSPSSPDYWTLSDINKAKQEVGEWMQAIAQFKSTPENHSTIAGVVTVDHLAMPASAVASAIPHYSGLGDKDITLSVSGTLDASEKTLREHHNEPQFHLVAYGPKNKVEMEYWHEDATQGGFFGIGEEVVGTLFRKEAANHPTIVQETVVHTDGGLVGSFTRPALE